MNATNPLAALETEAYKAGEYIFFEGDVEAHFYIVHSGTVQICTLNRQGQRLDICQINEGESFGEFALLDQKPRSAAALALTDVDVIRVSQEGFEELLEDLPVWASSMMKSFVDRLKNMTSLLKDVDQFKAR